MGFFNFSGGKATTTFKGKVQNANWSIDSGIVGINLKMKRQVLTLTFEPTLGLQFWAESAGKKNVVLEVTVTSEKPDVIIAYTILSFSS